MVFGISKNDSVNNKMFPDVRSNLYSNPDYFVTSVQTATGDANIQIKKKEEAKTWHGILLAAIVVGVVIIAAKKLD